MANPTMTLISSQTLGGTTASVTFSSIPSTYNDLKLVISARGDSVSGYTTFFTIKLNGDTGTNYSDTFIQGNSSAILSSHHSSVTSDQDSVFDNANATASTFGSTEIYIPNYNSTGSKPYFNINVTENNLASAGTAYVQAEASLYRGASGISSITLTPSSGNFVQYSNFYLYGIKNS